MFDHQAGEFGALPSGQEEEVAELRLDAQAERVLQQQEVQLGVVISILRLVLHQGTSAQSGARELVRQAQRLLSDALSAVLLSAPLEEGTSIWVFVTEAGEAATKREQQL